MNKYIATERVGRVNGRVRSHINQTRVSKSSLTVAVVVISHNYGHYLTQSVNSAQSQTKVPDEIIVIDDSSTDNTMEVAESLGVKCHRIDAGHQYYSMAEGLELTTSDIICFLDADDLLSPEYIEQGLKKFDSYDVGIVYSDMKKFGDSDETVVWREFSREGLARDNFMHAGSLVRREALVSSRALSVGIPGGMDCPTDWYVWRNVCREGWRGAKQSAHYMYRMHEKQQTAQEVFTEADHFYRGGLSAEVVTIFIPLSGRSRYWKRLSGFLNKQTWPKSQVQLILVDTSRSEKFHKRLKKWVFRSDYDDVRLVRYSPGEPPGQADANRHDDTVRHSVQRAVARIYNKMAREISTEFVMTIEDDVLPPTDAVRLLMNGFDPDTVSVAAPLLSRYHPGYLHWTWGKKICTEPGVGVEQIAGNGFGCTIIRGSVLKKTVFTSNPSFCNGDFDGSFYERLTDLKTKVQWKCACIHGDPKNKKR